MKTTLYIRSDSTLLNAVYEEGKWTCKDKRLRRFLNDHFSKGGDPIFETGPSAGFPQVYFPAKAMNALIRIGYEVDSERDFTIDDLIEEGIVY